jgi:hypothetical protein
MGGVRGGVETGWLCTSEVRVSLVYALGLRTDQTKFPPLSIILG